MRAPTFWWREKPEWRAMMLAPLGALVGMITLARMRRNGETVGVPVICIGNPIAGGAGKTPAALAIAERLLALGAGPAFVSRGYGGALDGPVKVDPARHDHRAVGDEPLLLARTAPAYVARDRLAGARLAAAEGAGVVVLDDGFQNPALAKTLSFLVVDGASGVGNGLCLPAGPLRAPLKPQLRRADAVIVIGAGVAGKRVAGIATTLGKPVLQARLVADAATVEALRGRAVVGFAGIGRPDKFLATLREAGARVAGFYPLGDHRAPRAAEAADILGCAARHGALIAATDKDMVKLLADPALADLADATLAVQVRLVFDQPERLDALLAPAINSASGQAASDV